MLLDQPLDRPSIGASATKRVTSDQWMKWKWSQDVTSMFIKFMNQSAHIATSESSLVRSDLLTCCSLFDVLMYFGSGRPETRSRRLGTVYSNYRKA